MKITVTTNGPLLIEGQVVLVDQNGRVYPLPAGARFALCRCGCSGHKPFCDGTHALVNFRAAPRALPEPDPADEALARIDPAH